MTKVAMDGALDRWISNVKETKRQANALQRVVQRILNGTLVSNFERWRDLIIEEKKMNGKTLKVDQRIMNATLVQGLEVWKDKTAGQGKVDKSKGIEGGSADHERRLGLDF